MWKSITHQYPQPWSQRRLSLPEEGPEVSESWRFQYPPPYFPLCQCRGTTPGPRVQYFGGHWLSKQLHNQPWLSYPFCGLVLLLKLAWLAESHFNCFPYKEKTRLLYPYTRRKKIYSFIHSYSVSQASCIFLCEPTRYKAKYVWSMRLPYIMFHKTAVLWQLFQAGTSWQLT